MPDGVARQIGVAFALSAFAVAVVAGLVSGAAASGTLARSLVVLVAASAIGRVLGAVLEACLNEHLTHVLRSTPIPESVSMRSRREAIPVEVVEDEAEQRP
ncbi:MAG: hypothetical protein IPJ41_14350 [Phycisphaerales bacterium]|nr:hypothetical protein [Phycisphaerales bacterium]